MKDIHLKHLLDLKAGNARLETKLEEMMVKNQSQDERITGLEVAVKRVEDNWKRGKYGIAGVAMFVVLIKWFGTNLPILSSFVK